MYQLHRERRGYRCHLHYFVRVRHCGAPNRRDRGARTPAYTDMRAEAFPCPRAADMCRLASSPDDRLQHVPPPACHLYRSIVAVARSRVFKVSHHLWFRLAGVARYLLAAGDSASLSWCAGNRGGQCSPAERHRFPPYRVRPAFPGGGQQGWRLAGGSDLWLAVQTSRGPGATLVPNRSTTSGIEPTMIWMTVLATAVSTAWIIEWAQRRCEQWAQRRGEAL
jgi:hypothetical protein